MRDYEPEEDRGSGILACFLFVPALVLFSFALSSVWPYVGDMRSTRWAADATAAGMAVVAVIAAAGMASGLHCLGERVDRSKLAITGIVLNSPLVVAGMVFVVMWARAVWGR